MFGFENVPDTKRNHHKLNPTKNQTIDIFGESVHNLVLTILKKLIKFIILSCDFGKDLFQFRWVQNSVIETENAFLFPLIINLLNRPINFFPSLMLNFEFNLWVINYDRNMTPLWPSLTWYVNGAEWIAFYLISIDYKRHFSVCFVKFSSVLKVNEAKNNQQLTYGKVFSTTVFDDLKRWHCGFK